MYLKAEEVSGRHRKVQLEVYKVLKVALLNPVLLLLNHHWLLFHQLDFRKFSRIANPEKFYQPTFQWVCTPVHLVQKAQTHDSTLHSQHLLLKNAQGVG